MKYSLSDRFLMAKQALFERAYSNLNPRQQESVFCVNGPLLVLAGAGSGKTSVLVRRIAFLIRYGNAYHDSFVPESLTEDQVRALESAAETLTPEQVCPLLDSFASNPARPYQVLAITFTNKAANEIKARLSTMFPDSPEIASDIWSGTFHSVCLRILRRFADRLGYRAGFSIYDTDDSKKAFSEALRRADIDEKMLPIKAVAAAVSRAKDNLITPEELEAEAGNDYRKKQIAKAYVQYQMLLRESNAMDFDDIIVQTVRLLQRHRDVAEYYQRMFRYVCVDEYQDTNHAQFVLTKLLSEGHGNIMVVGDDDQSIYKFRGATIENILSFEESYPNARVIRLEQNYRSTQIILDAANAVIAQNKGRMGKTLWTAKDDGAKIRLIPCEDQNDESRRMVDIIERAVAKGDRSYRDFAILYRMNAQSQSMEKAFARAAIPYRMLGALRFTDRKEIRDAIAYLQLIANHTDNVRLHRIINEPKRKIGAKTLEVISLLADEQGCSEFEIIERAREFPILKNAAPMLLDFATLINGLTESASYMRLDVLFDAVLDKSGYRQMLVSAGEAERERLENLEEFKSQIIEYAKDAENPTLTGFLEETALVAEVDRYDEEADAVVMMTVHSAKGLEFPVVLLPGMEETIFPGSQSIDAGPAELEEERRLAYVAITRAKQELVILHTSSRLLFGRTHYNPISRFVSEIPNNLIEKEKKQNTYGPGRYGGTIGYGSYGSSGSYGKNYGNSFGFGSSDPERPRTYFSASDAPSRASQAPFARSAAKSAPASPKTSGERFEAGARVRHMVFGEGDILSVKQMGTDVLYEIAFDRVGTKKLMGTYAKLKKV